MVLQEPGRVKQLVACCTNYYLRYLFIYFFSPNVSIPAYCACSQGHLNLQLQLSVFCLWLSGQGTNSAAPSGNLHSKSRRTRVLLCAPSNAAIDSLMKKVILIFKEKCRNINAPQGCVLAHTLTT